MMASQDLDDDVVSVATEVESTDLEHTDDQPSTTSTEPEVDDHTHQLADQSAKGQSRYWWCTVNNPVQGVHLDDSAPSGISEAYIDGIKSDPGVNYVGMVRHSAPTTGRVHLHVEVIVADRCYNMRIRKLLKDLTTYCAFRKGTHADCIAYFLKKGTGRNNLYLERGTAPEERGKAGGRATQIMWDEALMHAKAGNFENINSRIFITQVRNLEHINQRYAVATPFENQRREHTGIWISGASGLGKSEAVFSTYPNCYRKMLNIRWDGYKSEEVAVMDEMSPTVMKQVADHLKLWTSWQMFPADVKYGTVKVRLRHFIIISNWPLDLCMELAQLSPEQSQPIFNRFRQVNVTDHWSTGKLENMFTTEKLLEVPLPNVGEVPKPLAATYAQTSDNISNISKATSTPKTCSTTTTSTTTTIVDVDADTASDSRGQRSLISKSGEETLGGASTLFKYAQTQEYADGVATATDTSDAGDTTTEIQMERSVLSESTSLPISGAKSPFYIRPTPRPKRRIMISTEQVQDDSRRSW